MQCDLKQTIFSYDFLNPWKLREREPNEKVQTQVLVNVNSTV